MKRVPFSQVLKNARIDIRREYDRLYRMFCVNNIYGFKDNIITMKDICAGHFTSFPFRGTCVSLDDFDDVYGYRFEEKPFDFNLDYLVSFCEYSYNLARNVPSDGLTTGLGETIHFYLCQIKLVVEKIGYMANLQGRVIDFVPKDQVAISVAEIVDTSLSYRVIEYNHHSMKGDLERKKGILLALADKLEPLRDNLRHINTSLESDIFFLLNSVNLRHNNADPSGVNYKPFVAKMTKEEIEQCYDDTYQLCLLAFLELDNLDRKDRVKQLKANPKG